MNDWTVDQIQINIVRKHTSHLLIFRLKNTSQFDRFLWQAPSTDSRRQNTIALNTDQTRNRELRTTLYFNEQLKLATGYLKNSSRNRVSLLANYLGSSIFLCKGNWIAYRCGRRIRIKITVALIKSGDNKSLTIVWLDHLKFWNSLLRIFLVFSYWLFGIKCFFLFYCHSLDSNFYSSMR